MGVSVSSSALSVSNALLKRMNASSMGRPVSMLQRPLTKGAYEDVTPVWKQVAEAENAAVVEEAEAALQGAAEKA